MTFAGLMLFFKSPIGKKVLLGAAAAIAIWLACLHFIEVGRLKGEAAALQRSADSQSRLQAADEAATGKKLAAHDVRLSELQAQSEANRAQASQLGALVLELAKQRTAAVAKVDQVPDAGLHAYNVEQLHLRDPADRTACYLAPEERAIGKCLAAQPYFEQETKKASDRADKLEAEVAGVKDQVAEHQAKFDDLEAFTLRLQGSYVELYNLSAKPKRGLKCVYLWSCVRPKLPTPDPKTFLQTSADKGR
jgi:hypothetical protein